MVFVKNFIMVLVKKLSFVSSRSSCGVAFKGDKIAWKITLGILPPGD